MNKYTALKLLNVNGDSTVSLNTKEDIVATTDFSTPYIRRKKFGRYPFKKDFILVFSWTDNEFRNIDVKTVKTITPLSKTLGNIRDGEKK